MPKVVMIGAGSAGFCRMLVQDLLCFESLRQAHIVLMDIDEKCLEKIFRVMQLMKAQNGLQCDFSATTNLREALEGADYAISMIQVGGLDPYVCDLEIPLKYGVDQCVGDTMNPGGLFRGLRHTAAFMEMLEVMTQVCPDVIFMNYANPMAICSWAMQQAYPQICSVGLCHGVEHTRHMLERWLGIEQDEMQVLTAGINHMAWFLQIRHNGRDLYPQMWEKLQSNGPVAGEEYRFEMFKATGYFMTESPGHLSEYLPYFRKRRDLQELFGGPGFSGETGAYLKMCRKGYQEYHDELDSYISGKVLVPYDAHGISVEYAARIINAHLTGQPYQFFGNILNRGHIQNLPDGACVEVPMYADASGLHGANVGCLPDVCAALCQSNISFQRLAVKAALEGDYEAAFQACLLDPLTAAVLAPHEIRNMVEELFAAQVAWLPQFTGKVNDAPGATIGRLDTSASMRSEGVEIDYRIGHFD